LFEVLYESFTLARYRTKLARLVMKIKKKMLNAKLHAKFANVNEPLGFQSSLMFWTFKFSFDIDNLAFLD
jgi:hypothetical protein